MFKLYLDIFEKCLNFTTIAINKLYKIFKKLIIFSIKITEFKIKERKRIRNKFKKFNTKVLTQKQFQKLMKKNKIRFKYNIIKK